MLRVHEVSLQQCVGLKCKKESGTQTESKRGGKEDLSPLTVNQLSISMPYTETHTYTSSYTHMPSLLALMAQTCTTIYLHITLHLCVQILLLCTAKPKSIWQFPRQWVLSNQSSFHSWFRLQLTPGAADVKVLYIRAVIALNAPWLVI